MPCSSLTPPSLPPAPTLYPHLYLLALFLSFCISSYWHTFESEHVWNSAGCRQTCPLAAFVWPLVTGYKGTKTFRETESVILAASSQLTLLCLMPFLHPSLIPMPLYNRQLELFSLKAIPEISGFKHQVLLGIESCSRGMGLWAACQIACVCSAWSRGFIWLFWTLASLHWGQRICDGLASLSGPLIL